MTSKVAYIGSQWYRIDKTNGEILAVAAKAVDQAASHYYVNAGEVSGTGRFSTPFAIYSLGHYITVHDEVGR